MFVHPAGDPVGAIVDDDIWHGGAEFLVFVGCFGIPGPEGQAHERAVEQGASAGGDDRAVGRQANELTDAEGFIGMGENFGIGVAPFVAERDRRLEPGGKNEAFAGWVIIPELEFVFFQVFAGPARDGVGVLFVVEHRHEVVGGRATAIVAHVHDDAVLAVAGGGEFPFHRFEAGHIHTPHVDIPEPAFGVVVHQFFAIVHPFLVELISEGCDGPDGDFPRFPCRVAHFEEYFFVNGGLEQLVEVGRWAIGVSVDGDDDLARVQLAFRPGCRRFRDDAHDAHALCGGAQFCAQHTGRFALGFGAVGGAQAHVAGVDFPQQVVEHIAEVVGRRSVDTAFAVLFAECVPVVAVVLGIVEPVAYGAPGLFEDLFAFCGVVDFHFGGEGQGFLLATFCIQSGERPHPSEIEVFAFSVHLYLRGVGTAFGEFLQFFAVPFDAVQVASAGTAAGGSVEEGLAVLGDGEVALFAGETRHLYDALVDTLKVDLHGGHA